MGEWEEVVPPKECKFVEAWVGMCKQDTDEGGEFCETHSQMVCFECGEQAVRTCAHTSQFVCGFPMCEKHQHHSDG